jgi:PleD family two-component response regulator
VKTIVPTEQCDQMSFLEQVDQNLYQAKQQGRNCYQADYVDALEDLKE